MPEKLGSAVLDLSTDSSKYSAGVRQAKDEAGKLNTQLNKVSESAIKLGKSLTLGLTAPLVAAATAFVVLADKQIQAEAALTNAIRATGREAEISLAAMKDFTAELQNITTFGDEAQLSALALVQQLADLNQDGLQAILPGMLDFSTAMGVSLQTAASLMGKTLGSSTNALARYGIEIDTAASPTEKLAQLTEALAEKFGGAAEAAAAAGLGPFRQMKNSAGDLAEQFGTLLLPAVNKIVAVFQDVIEWTSSLDDNTKSIILTLGGLAAALGPVAIGIGLVSKAMAAMALPPAGTMFLVITAIALVVTGLVALMVHLKGARRDYDDLKAAMEALAETETEKARRLIASLPEQIAAREAHLATAEAALEATRATREALQTQAEGAGILSPAMIALRGINEQWVRQSFLVEIARGSLESARAALVNAKAALTETVTAVDDVSDAVVEMSDKWITWQGLIKKGGSSDPFKFIVEGSIAAVSELTTLNLHFGNVFLSSNLLLNSIVSTGEALKSFGTEIKDFAEIVTETLAPALEALPGQVTGGPPGSVAGPFQATPNVGGINPDLMNEFSSALTIATAILGPLAEEVAGLALVMDPLSLLMEGFAGVVGVAMNEALVPLVGFFIELGKTLGVLFLPLIKRLGEVIEKVVGAFIKFFNNVLSPFILVIQTIGALLFNLGVLIKNIITLNFSNLGEGMIDVGAITQIQLPTIATAKATGRARILDKDPNAFTPGASTGAGATFRQQRPITVTINVFDNQVFGGSLQDFAVIIRDEILEIAELGL